MDGTLKRISGHPATRIAFRIICMIVVAVTSYMALRGRIAEIPYHHDEAGWISSSFYYSTLWGSGDRSFERWAYIAPGLTGYAWGYLQTHLGQFMLGAPLTYQMVHDDEVDPFFGFYSYMHTLEENRLHGAFPSSGTLLGARHINVLYWTLCIVLMFLLASAVANEFAGVVAVAILLLSDSFMDGATRAMIDAPNGIFYLGIGFSAVAVARANSMRTFLGASTLFGLFCGLACSVKVTGLVFGMGFLLVLYLVGIALAKFPARRCIAGVMLAGISALFVVYALNPLFCPSVEAFSASALKQEVVEISGRPPIWKDDPHYPAMKYEQLANLSRVLEFPLLYPRWHHFLELSKAGRAWGESRLETFHSHLFIEFAAFPFQWVLVVLGVVFGVGRLIQSARERTLHVRAVPFLYFAANYGFILLLMKHNWDRYYYTTVVAACLLAGICASEIVASVIWLWRRARSTGDGDLVEIKMS